MKSLSSSALQQKIKLRQLLNKITQKIFLTVTIFGITILAILISRILIEGIPALNWNFLTGKLSTDYMKAGVMGAILGTFWLMVVITPITFIVGVATAIYLHFYVRSPRVKAVIQTNIANLAGVPSIVYGILGLTIFVRTLKLGNIVLAGGLTMTLLILPIVIVASQEAIQAVPQALGEASYGMGATKWQTIIKVILPLALPGILTGAILAISRAMGETAPLVVIGIPALLIPFPGGIFDKFTVLPMQIYYWTLDSALVAEYANLAAATIIILFICLILLNSIAIFIRYKFQKDIYI